MNTGSLDPLFGGVDGGGVLLPEGNHLPLHLFDLQHVELEEGEGDGSSVADSEDWTKFDEKDWCTEGGNVEVDQTPLQNQLKKNKESLAVKLKLRRPMTALVEQGIMPEYKTSPSLHEQRTKLERAQMGDRLRQKIASRPDRQELVHRHILEDVRPDVDPSLCSRQRQLKRAKLADSLASQLSHRPGPLELIQKNILHTDDPVEQMVKEGSISFTSTEEGVVGKPLSSISILEEISQEEDSNDTAPSPATDSNPVSDLHSDSSSSNVPGLLSQTSDAGLYEAGGRLVYVRQVSECENEIFLQNKSSRSESLGDINARPLQSIGDPEIRLLSRSGSLGGDSFGSIGANSSFGGNSSFGVNVSFGGNTSFTNSSFDVSSLESPSFSSTSSGVSSLSGLTGPSLQRDAPGKERKKVKLKKPGTAPKPRTIKFHEYKGPEPSLKRKMEDRKASSDTPYDLLLKQQQLCLQWQLENQNKYPQILLPATSRNSLMSIGSSISPSLIGSSSVSLNSGSQTSSSVPSPASSIPSTPRSNTPIRSLLLTPQDVNHATSLLNRLDDMKVTELKMELKKRGLGVSGPKPVLIDRLRPILEEIIAAGRQQFQQPYKQISIPRGGLIILKPSPNSQLLTRPEPNSDIVPHTPQSMHEGTPDSGEDAPMTPLGSGPGTPFSPVSMMSPGVREESSPQLQSMDLDFNLNLMEAENCISPRAPPPPPPPPPPDKFKPAPLPAPPTAKQQVATTPVQFVPQMKTNQQILLAKQQLESSLSSSSSSIQPPATVRAGPKGQFIWPPVSVQSAQGTVTIRARNTVVSSQSDQRMSSTPIAQLAAVFSQSSSQFPSGPIHLSNSEPNLQLSKSTNEIYAKNPGNLRFSNMGEVELNRSSSLQLPCSIQLPQEPIPPAELGLVISTNSLTCSIPSTYTNSSVVSSIAGVQVYEVPANQLPATLPLPSSSTSHSPTSTHNSNNQTNSFQVHTSYVQSLQNGVVQHVPGENLHSNSVNNLDNFNYGNGSHNISHKVSSHEQTNLQQQQQQQQQHVQPQLQQQLQQQHQVQFNQRQSSPEEVLKHTEDIIKQQQQQIQELQRALQRSQQLAQQQMLSGHQSANKKVVLAQHLQKKQLSNQIQLLQQQLNKSQEQHHFNKVQEQQAAAIQLLNNQETTGEQNMEDVLDIILTYGYDDGPSTAPPPPPPPPARNTIQPMQGSPPPLRQRTPPPAYKNPPIDLPQLDFGDLSFDLGHLPELGWAEQLRGDKVGGGGMVDDNMDVDMDVADWLDSLLPANNQPGL